MSYAGLGQTATATTTRCVDGRTVTVPAGMDPDTWCRATHAVSTTPATASGTSMPTADQIASIATAAGTSIAAIIAALNQQHTTPTTPAVTTTDPTLMQPSYQMQLPPPSPMPGWVLPAAIGGGVLLIGLLFVAGRRKHTVTVSANRRRRGGKRSRRNPVPRGYSRKTFGKIVARERRAGKSRKQAVAIAYRSTREAARRAGKRPAYLRRQAFTTDATWSTR